MPAAGLSYHGGYRISRLGKIRAICSGQRPPASQAVTVVKKNRNAVVMADTKASRSSWRWTEPVPKQAVPSAPAAAATVELTSS